MNTKDQYRQQALNRRRALSSEDRVSASLRIRNTLLSQLDLQELIMAPVLIYRSMDDEVDTRRILAMNRPLMFAPSAHDHEGMRWYQAGPDTCWETGKFGVEEPVGERVWEPGLGKSVLICPLVGFDRAGNRLGLGMGCFDRWLNRFGEYLLTTIGLAFSCQEVPAIPVEPHDIPLNTIITERGIIECRRQ